MKAHDIATSEKFHSDLTLVCFKVFCNETVIIMSKPNTPGKADEFVLSVPMLPANDRNLTACRLLMLTVEKEKSGKVNEELLAGLVSMGELREQFKLILDRLTSPDITFDNIIDLPRYSIIVATNTLQEADYKAYFLEEGNEKFSLHDAIEHARRLTEQNILRWLFEMFTCLSGALTRFITLRHLTPHNVTLDSDYSHFVTIHHFNKEFVKFRHGKYMVGKSRMNYGKLEEDARHAWLHLIPSPEETGFPTQEDLFCRVHTIIRNGDQLLRSGQLNRVNSELKKEELHPDYVAFVRRVQRNYRDFGAMAIQLATHTLLTDEEARRLKHYHYIPPVSKDIAKRSSPSPPPTKGQPANINNNISSNNNSSPTTARSMSNKTPRHLSSRGNSATGSDLSPLSRNASFRMDSARTRPTSSGVNTARESEMGEAGSRPMSRGNTRLAEETTIPIIQESETDMLKHILQDLVRWFPSLSNSRPEIRDLIALCYAPMTMFLTLHGTSHRSFPIPYLPRLKTILTSMRHHVLRYHHDTLYEAPEIWDEEVIKYREEEKERYQQQMAEKAKKGFDRAHRRIQQERYQLWLSMQTEDYRRKREHRKKMQIVTTQHRKERDRLIHTALFHTWESKDLMTWLEKALNQYFEVALNFRAKMDQLHEEHQRKVSVARHKHQQQQEIDHEKERQELKLKRQRRKRNAEEESAEEATKEANVDNVLHGGINRLIRQQVMQKSAVATPTNTTEQQESRKTATPQIVVDSALMYHRVDEVHVKRILEEVFLPIDPYLTSKIIGTFCTGGGGGARHAMLASSSVDTADDKTNVSGNKKVTLTSSTSLSSMPTASADAHKNNTSSKSNNNSKTAASATNANALTPALQRIQRLKEKKEEMVLMKTDESYRVHRMSQEEKVVYCLQVIAREWPAFFVPHITTYELCHAMARTLKAVDEQCEELDHRGKFLVISEEQVFYKRNAMQSAYFLSQCVALRTSSFAFCDAMQIVDRARARKITAFLASACMYQYVQDAQTRLAGEIIAADRVRAFFRMIVAHKRLRPIIEEKTKHSLSLKASQKHQQASASTLKMTVTRKESSSVLATLTSHALATTRASMMQKQQKEEKEARKVDTLSIKSSMSGLDSDFLATLLGKTTTDDKESGATSNEPAAPQTHNDAVLQQLLQQSQQTPTASGSSHNLTDRAQVLHAHRSAQNILSPKASSSAGLSSRPSFLSGGLNQLPGAPSTSSTVEDFTTNRLMMTGMNKLPTATSAALIGEKMMNTDILGTALVEEDNENEAGKDGEDDEDEDEDGDEYDVSIISDLSALSIDKDEEGRSKKSRKRRSTKSDKMLQSRKMNTSGVSSAPITKASMMDGSMKAAAMHAVTSDPSLSIKHHHRHHNSSLTPIKDHPEDDSDPHNPNALTKENNGKSNKGKKATVIKEIVTPYPAVQLSVEDIRGDAMRMKMRILVASQEYAQDLCDELQDAHNVTIYRPKHSHHHRNKSSDTVFPSLLSSSSGTTPLFISIKSKAQQTFEKYGGFQDLFHRHRHIFLALPQVEEYRVTSGKYVPTEQECKLLPLEVVPAHMRSKLAAAASATGTASSGGGGLQMIKRKDKSKDEGEEEEEEEEEKEGDKKGKVIVPLPTFYVDVTMMVIGLRPVHRYQLYMTLDQKLSDRLCRYYLAPLSTANTAPNTNNNAGENRGLVKQDHPFRAANNAAIAHAMQNFDHLPITQRFVKYMPMIPPPPAAIAAFTTRTPYLAVMSSEQPNLPSRPTTSTPIVDELEISSPVVDPTVSLLIQSLQEHGHDTTTLIALSFSQSYRTIATKPEAPYPFEVKLAYRSLGPSVSLTHGKEDNNNSHAKHHSNVTARLASRNKGINNVTAEEHERGRGTMANPQPPQIPTLLSFFLGDERAPTSSLRVLCHVTWPASSEDIPKHTTYQLQRRFVLRPIAQIAEWKEMGLIDDGSEQEKDHHDNNQNRIVTPTLEQQRKQEVVQQEREERELRIQKRNNARRTFLGNDEDDDNDNNGKTESRNASDDENSDSDDVNHSNRNSRPDSAVNRMRSRSAKQRLHPRPLSSLVSSTRYLQHDRLYFGAWTALPSIPTTSLQATVQYEDLFSLTSDADSLLTSPVYAFLEHYIHLNRSILSGVAPFQMFSPAVAATLPAFLLPPSSSSSSEENKNSHHPSAHNNNHNYHQNQNQNHNHSTNHTTAGATGWCYAGFDIYVEYRVRVVNSAGEGDFARHQVFFKPHAHYHADATAQMQLNQATIAQEPFRLASLLLRSVLSAHTSSTAGETSHTNTKNDSMMVKMKEKKRSQQATHHPIVDAALQQQYQQKQQWLQAQLAQAEEQERNRQAQAQQQALLDYLAAEKQQSSCDNNNDKNGNGDKMAEDDPWLKNLALQSPFFS